MRPCRRPDSLQRLSTACRSTRCQPAVNGKPGASRGRKARGLVQGEMARPPAPPRMVCCMQSLGLRPARIGLAGDPGHCGGHRRHRSGSCDHHGPRHIVVYAIRCYRSRSFPATTATGTRSLPGRTPIASAGPAGPSVVERSITTTTLADGSVGTVLNLPSGAQAVSPIDVRDVGVSRGPRRSARRQRVRRRVLLRLPTRARIRGRTPRNTGQMHGNQTAWTLANPVNVQPAGGTELAAGSVHVRSRGQDERLPAVRLLRRSALQVVALGGRPESARAKPGRASCPGSAGPWGRTRA